MTRRDLMATKGGLSAIAVTSTLFGVISMAAAVHRFRSDLKEARRG